MDNSLRMTRGNIAKLININAETIRYYEEQKLIKKPQRLANNYRVYDEDDIKRIKFILMSKQLGFSLKEIKELLNLSITGKSDRKKVRNIVSNKLNLINEKIKQLSVMKSILNELFLLCQGTETATHCPILKSLYQEQEN